MTGVVNDLSNEQIENLNQFKKNLHDVLQPEHDDYYLLRWLRARKFDLKKAEKMLRDHFEYRIKYNYDELLTEWKPPEVLEKYMIGGLYGYDRDGHPVWYDPYGCLDTKGIFYSCSRFDFVKYKIMACEAIQEVFREQSKKEGRKIETLNVVFDLAHADWSHLWKPFIDNYSHVVTVYESNYPETLRRCIVINAPKMFAVGFQLIKPFLSEETKKKVTILGSNYKEKLKEVIHPDQLPVHYGGNAKDEFGDPKCGSKICYGGVVPSSYYLKNSKCIEGMDTCTVHYGTYKDILFDVTQPHSFLRWNFRTIKDNVGFGVFMERDNVYGGPKEMVPVVKYDSHMMPEAGGITCEAIGRYVVRFDNSYSWLKSKKVYYSIDVLPPDLNLIET